MKSLDKTQLAKVIYGVIQSLDEIFVPGSYIYGEQHQAPMKGSWTLRPEGNIFLAGDGEKIKSFRTGKNHFDSLGVTPQPGVNQRVLTYCIGESIQAYKIIQWKEHGVALITASDDTHISEPWVAFIPLENLPEINENNTPCKRTGPVTVKEMEYSIKKHQGWSYKEAYRNAGSSWLEEDQLPQFKNNRYLSGQWQHATYVGPLSAWHGKRAMIYNVVAAQFDDKGHYMAGGWSLFKETDWKIQKRVPIFRKLSAAVVARANSIASKNSVWMNKWNEEITSTVKNFFPSGSGFDQGTWIDVDSSSDKKLVFVTSFHHMDDNGSYDGWTEHQVIVTPSLASDFDIRVTGSNRNAIKDYIAEAFSTVLSTEV